MNLATGVHSSWGASCIYYLSHEEYQTVGLIFDHDNPTAFNSLKRGEVAVISLRDHKSFETDFHNSVTNAIKETDNMSPSIVDLRWGVDGMSVDLIVDSEKAFQEIHKNKLPVIKKHVNSAFLNAGYSNSELLSFWIGVDVRK